MGGRLWADQAALRAWPAGMFEPCETRAARVSSTALVRYRTNDYSVPTRYGFQDVVVKGFVDTVVILCGNQEVARHARRPEGHTSELQSLMRSSYAVFPLEKKSTRPKSTHHVTTRQ